MALEAGLLTLGSSYWPTPSQRWSRQWSIPLAFVPDHSGASVRELHPLPSMLPLEQQQRLLLPCYHGERQMSSPFLCDQARSWAPCGSPSAPPDQPSVLERRLREVAAAERFTRAKQGYRRLRCRPCLCGFNGRIGVPSRR
jgi:hypothetical protein